MAEYNLHQLSNGIRILHKQIFNSKIVHCGFVLDIGSRDEKPHQQGIAHFWEHMAFKGTKKRKAFHILNRLDSVGGELNAYTTKEKICFYASVLDNYFDKAIELLTDITFDSIFPEKQIERERNVILEEMSMYLDAPEDAIQDEFDEVVFPDHPLGRNILGTQESVRNFTREDFKAFILENLNTGKIVFSYVGNMPYEKVLKVAQKHLEAIPAYSADNQRLAFQEYLPTHKSVFKPLSQAHCAIGRTAYPLMHEARIPFFALINILGGPGMNSRLNMALREKHGFVYGIEASYQPYNDTGLMAIFFATEGKQLKRSIKLVMQEFDKLKKKPLGTLQLHKAKEQLRGQLAMAEENNMNLMLMMGKSLLDAERVESLEEIFDLINSITANQLLEISREVFQEDMLSMLTYIPEK